MSEVNRNETAREAECHAYFRECGRVTKNDVEESGCANIFWRKYWPLQHRIEQCWQRTVPPSQTQGRRTVSRWDIANQECVLEYEHASPFSEFPGARWS